MTEYFSPERALSVRMYVCAAEAIATFCCCGYKLFTLYEKILKRENK